ncbi:MAG: helix-turn-helix domain-containing protein [Acetobacteraceae bacterium]
MGHEATVPSHRFSTARLPKHEQAAAWGAWFASIFEVVSARADDEGFAAVNEVWRVGDLTMSRVSAPAVRVVRDRAHLRRNPVDHWILSYCKHGNVSIRTGNGETRVSAGQPYLWSLAEETESFRSAVERIQIFLPRDTFRDLAGTPDPAIGLVFDSPMGRIPGDFIRTLERQVPNLTSAELPRLAGAVGSVVAACVAPSPGRLAEARGPIDVGRMERLRQTVRKHLRSPQLGPNTLGRLVGASRSQLYRLLEETGGVGRYIQRQRLSEAYRNLSDPENKAPIFAIAEELCFEDASSFSRAFRHEFQARPSEVRQAALAGLRPLSPPNRPDVAEPRVFGDLLGIV